MEKNNAYHQAILLRFLKSSHKSPVAHATTPFFLDPHVNPAYKNTLNEHIRRNLSIVISFFVVVFL
jgi:hypothetical protein